MILVFDVETTGIDPQADTVVEVAAVPVVNNPCTVAGHDQFGIEKTERGDIWTVLPGASSLVAPGRRVPPAARAVHHIGDEELRTAPKLRGALTDVFLRCGFEPSKPAGGVLLYAAHNADFDRGFIGSFLSQDVPWLCTWRCALHLFPEAQSHSNQALRYTLRGVDEDVKESMPLGASPHRALYDATTTAFLLQRMLLDHTIEELLALQEQPVLQRTVRFGKHRGVPWDSVPIDYCKWILRADPPFDRDVQHTARHYLEKAQAQ